jgi:hypothetical protein
MSEAVEQADGQQADQAQDQDPPALGRVGALAPLAADQQDRGAEQHGEHRIELLLEEHLGDPPDRHRIRSHAQGPQGQARRHLVRLGRAGG